MSNALHCKKVSKSFLLQDGDSAWRVLFRLNGGERFEALSDVTLKVPKGEFVGILGRNGAGKSTFLRTVGGVYAPDSGVVNLSGELSALYELGLTGNEQLTGREFAGRWFQTFASRGDKRKDLLKDTIEFSELGGAFDRPIRTYSAGMKSRLFFALATARKSKIYIIDEVLSVGDEYFQNKCWRRIRQRLTGGASGIIATHDWSAIMRLCPTSYILDKGRVTHHGPTSAMVREYLALSPDDCVEGARLADSTPELIEATSLETFEHEFEIEVTSAEEVAFSASVEVFVAGFGWEHVLHTDPQLIPTSGPGTYIVRMQIPNLPLKSGDYALAVGLSRDDSASGGRKAYDVRSWTHNESITLRVTGAESGGAVRWPLRIAHPAALHRAAE